jgi:hypothetical protein
MTIQDRVSFFAPQLASRIERDSFASWKQRAPKRGEKLTFSHTGGFSLVAGNMTLQDTIINGYTLRYTAEEPFTGIWAYYEEPPVDTEPFNTVVLQDEFPSQVLLLDARQQPVEHGLRVTQAEFVVYSLVSQVTDRASWARS